MNYYETSQSFDKEMSQLFLKARRWYELGTDAYGNVLALQVCDYPSITPLHPLTSLSISDSIKPLRLPNLRHLRIAPRPSLLHFQQDRARLRLCTPAREILLRG